MLEVCVDQLQNHEISLACVPTTSAVDRAKNLSVKRMDIPEHSLTGTWSNLALCIAEQIEKKTIPIGFVFCTNPVFFKFNNVTNFLSRGNTIAKTSEGSAMVVYPFKHYVLDENMQGVNYGLGHWHRYSQHLPQWYINPWALIVTTAEKIEKYSYWHTPDVTPLIAAGPCIDVDTEDEFQLAKGIYASSLS